ncbi:MAG: RND family transporter [Deltaproteobacteria bacterium]|nr:MAG: RND family transporter [Deltaproteobacteria bacterium]
MKDKAGSQFEIISKVADFDIQTGSLLERFVFNFRPVFLAIFVILTILLSYNAWKVRLNASLERMIPTKHPYLRNYMRHKEQLRSLSNVLRVVVETKNGTIYTAEYLEQLRKINDDLFFIPGVDRMAMKSLWTPAVRWREVTEEGIAEGPVMPDTYDGSPKSVEQVKLNVERAGIIGKLVGNDHKSSTILVPLLDFDPETGKPLDYGKLHEELEKVRSKHESETIKIHIIGFAQIVGDLIHGLKVVSAFFAIAVAIAAGMLFWYTRCVWSTILVVSCSVIAVVWQLGFLQIAGMEVDPYSMLVPFLVFSIGMSHGSQKMNGVLQDIGRGAHRYVAARYTFRRLFTPGVTAVLSDAVGFSVLIFIQIKVIQQTAIAAGIGVAVIIFTHLIMIPVILSYTGVSKKAAVRALRIEEAELSGEKTNPVYKFLTIFTNYKAALICIVVFLILGGIGGVYRTNLKIGSLSPGAPELRPDSRYNRDNAYVTSHYRASSDIFVTMVETGEYKCTNYDNLMKVDALEEELLQLPGVDSTNSLAQVQKLGVVGFNEGCLFWYDLVPNQPTLNQVVTRAPRNLFNNECNLILMYAYLTDHKAETLQSVVDTVEKFRHYNDSKEIRFLPAAGNAGIQAATNIVVKKSMKIVLTSVYAAVILLCFITFHSWKGVLAALVPLILTSILCDSLMVWQRIGVKVATLPVVALGVGIGVDYALYVLSVVLANMRRGMALSEAYYRALLFTGKIVVLIGITLSCGVATWAFSPIKFQADMGLLLSFMFLWNMVGALVLMPAILCVLTGRKHAS